MHIAAIIDPSAAMYINSTVNIYKITVALVRKNLARKYANIILLPNRVIKSINAEPVPFMKSHR